MLHFPVITFSVPRLLFLTVTAVDRSHPSSSPCRTCTVWSASARVHVWSSPWADASACGPVSINSASSRAFVVCFGVIVDVVALLAASARGKHRHGGIALDAREHEASDAAERHGRVRRQLWVWWQCHGLRVCRTCRCRHSTCRGLDHWD
jgi:hypothetical protein